MAGGHNYEQSQTCITRKAAADLRTKQYFFVTLDANGDVVLANAAGEKVIGVLQNKPNVGEAASICILGLSQVVAGVAIAPDAYIATDAAGKAKDVAAAATGRAAVKTDDAGVALDPVIGSHVAGFSIGEATADLEIITAFISPMGAVPTTFA